MKFIIPVLLLMNYFYLVQPYAEHQHDEGSLDVLPSVEKCRFSDSKCLRDSFQKALPLFADGIPELGIQKMDEMLLEDKTYKLGGLDLTLKDGRVKGLKSIIFNHVSMDTDKKVIRTEFHAKKCSMKGKYQGVGSIRLLPLRGSGDIILKFRNVAIVLNMTYAMEKKSEKDYIIPKSYSFDYDVKDYAHFNLTNLFNGNEELSNTVLTFLNENWKEVSREFGRPIMEQQARQIFKNVRTYLSNSPVDEIFVV